MVSVITEKLQNTGLSDIRWNKSIYSEPVRLKSEATSSTDTILIGDKKTRISFIDNVRYKEYEGVYDPKFFSIEQEASTTTQLVTLPPQTQRDLETPPACPHSPNDQKCSECETTNPPAPPKKKHCRSLSIPGDSPDTFAKWHGHTGRLHRPVALRPHNNNNKHSMKNRNSPVLSHCTRGSFYTRQSPVLVCSRGSNLSLPGNLTSNSPWNFTISPHDYINTPPESPVPRPASASSGYYDSSLNSIHSAPWLDPTAAINRLEMFKIRSLSMEDAISCKKSCSEGCGSRVTGGSMPSVSVAPGSMPSSPRRHRIPRCHSQPCVMHDKRTCGVKRRLDEDRPSLDFAKMTAKMTNETAMKRANNMPCNNRVRHKTINIPQHQASKSSRISLTAKFDCMKTIASSPLDSNFPSSLGRTPTMVSPVTIKADLTQGTDFDSGCSTTNDPPNIIEVSSDLEDNESCNCHDSGIDGAPEDDQMFHMDSVNNDIDLDQMEND